MNNQVDHEKEIPGCKGKYNKQNEAAENTQNEAAQAR